MSARLVAAQQALCRALAHEFAQPELLQQALTHSSRGTPHYERLEFLGDSVLSLIITEQLYARFPNLREGRLSRIRAALVNGRTLAVIAREAGVGEALLLGKGELRAGAQRRDSILADSLEALIGAIYLDAGLEVCRQRVLALYADRLADPDLGASPKDNKTRLQEWLMARGENLPSYSLDEETGPPNDRRFAVSCSVETAADPTRGVGRTRRSAEQVAAGRMLEQLETDRG